MTSGAVRKKRPADDVVFIWELRGGDFGSSSVRISGWAFPRTKVRAREATRGNILGQFEANPQFMYGKTGHGSVASVQGYLYERDEERGDLHALADRIDTGEFAFAQMFAQRGRCVSRALTEHPRWCDAAHKGGLLHICNMTVEDKWRGRGLMLDMARDLLDVELAAAKLAWQGGGPTWSLVVVKSAHAESKRLATYFSQLGFAAADGMLFMARGTRDDVAEDARLAAAVTRGVTSRHIFALHEVEYIWELRGGELGNAAIKVRGWAMPRGDERKTTSRVLPRGTLLKHDEPNPQFEEDKADNGAVARVEGVLYQRYWRVGDGDMHAAADSVDRRQMPLVRMFTTRGICKERAFVQHPRWRCGGDHGGLLCISEMTIKEEWRERGVLLDMMRDLVDVELDTKKVYWDGDGPLWSLVVSKLFVRQANCFSRDFAALGFTKVGDKLMLVRESRYDVPYAGKDEVKAI